MPTKNPYSGAMLRAARFAGALLPTLPLALLALLVFDARANLTLGAEHFAGFAYEDVTFGFWFDFTVAAVPLLLLSLIAFYVLKLRSWRYWSAIGLAFLVLAVLDLAYRTRLDAMLLNR